MVIVLTWSAVDHVFEPRSGQTNDSASPLSTQHEEIRAKTGYIGIKIQCKSPGSHLSADCFRELAF